MKRALLFGALWLAATAATGAVAWGAVRLAGEQTAEQAVRPMTARQVEALAASSTTGAATTGAATSTLIAPVTTSTVALPTTVVGVTTTTGSQAGPVVAGRQTRGGTVVVSLQGGRLSLASATPAAGFVVDVKEAGPDEVVVVFEGGEGDEIRVRASVADGEISFKVETGEDD